MILKKRILIFFIIILLFAIPFSLAAVKQCEDGIDNDGNGCADYPADSGCIATNDNNESGGYCSCSVLSGSCCTFGQLCTGGIFTACSDCDNLCCVGGSCTDPTHLECSGRSCASVSGAGANQCSINADCYSCGDGTCDANENCANCSADCLHAGEVCCSGISYTGNCCTDTNCLQHYACQSYNCVYVPYCGDGTCDANENCANCSADCSGASSQCCSATSSNADSKGYVNSTKVTTPGNICCGGAIYTGQCCTDAECSSPNTCNTSSHACIAPQSAQPAGCTAQSCLCSLSISINASLTFNSSIARIYQISVSDSLRNYSGSVGISYWIENSSGYIGSYSPLNTTMNVNSTISRSYTPPLICGEQTQYIKARLISFGCNNSNAANNLATKTITLAGTSISLCPAVVNNSNVPPENPIINQTEETETPEPVAEQIVENAYNLNVPEEINFSNINLSKDMGDLKNKTIKIKVNIENKKNETKTFEVWSYLYNDSMCYSCINGSEQINRKTVVLEAGSSATIELESKFNATRDGMYKLKINILEEGASAPKEYDYDIKISGIEVKQTLIGKIIKYLLWTIISAGLIALIFLGIKNRQKIVSTVQEKLKEYKKRRAWKKKIEERRGKGILERIERGFLKPQPQNVKKIYVRKI